MQPAILSLPFLKKEPAGQNIYSFYFDRRNKRFSFLPGQYMRVRIPGVQIDPRGDSRMLSITSSPMEKNIIMHTTRITESPYKKALMKLKKGDSVDFFGPVGRFVMDEDFKGTHVLLSGGMGITPFRSMLKYAEGTNSKLKLLLIASFSEYDDIVFLDELLHTSKSSGGIAVIYTISGENSLKKWKGEKGRISSDLVLRNISNPDDCKFYICGSEIFALAVEDELLALGVREESISMERFKGY